LDFLFYFFNILFLLKGYKKKYRLNLRDYRFITFNLFSFTRSTKLIIFISNYNKIYLKIFIKFSFNYLSILDWFFKSIKPDTSIIFFYSSDRVFGSYILIESNFNSLSIQLLLLKFIESYFKAISP
jgi:hypothetical protein